MAVEAEAKEAAQRNAPGNSLQDEAEASDARGEGEDQGQAVLAMMGALQVGLFPRLITIFIAFKEAKPVQQARNGHLSCKDW